MTSETFAILGNLIPYMLGDRKRVEAGLEIIQTNTIKHMIIERFLIRQEPYQKFSYQDVQEVLEREFYPRIFGIGVLRHNITFLSDSAFPYKTVKRTFYPRGVRGLRTEFFLTARIKKISYPKNVVDQMNGFELLLYRSVIVRTANKSIQVKNYRRNMNE